jgi:O-antigen/teichoic acid export membrane protein
LSADGRIGSDWVLKWIGLVVLMSFIKQVHNYLFVSTGDQNILLPINLLGVALGLPAAVILIQRFELV